MQGEGPRPLARPHEADDIFARMPWLTVDSCSPSPHASSSADFYAALVDSFCRRGPPTMYGWLCLTMCQMIVASRRITATRAIFEPRRLLIFPYQARIEASFRSTCSTNWPRMKRAVPLPCLVIEPNRSVTSPELRHRGVSPQ